MKLKGYLLGSIARYWVVNDLVKPADAIVVLGGALDIRPAAAAALYMRGIAPLVVVSKSDADSGREASRMRDRLRIAGVSTFAIADFSITLHSTYGEALGVARFAKAHHLRRVIIPVEIFQTRRVRWIFARVLSDIGVQASVAAITPPNYSLDDWWQRDQGRFNFRSELIKFAYYKLRY